MDKLRQITNIFVAEYELINGWISIDATEWVDGHKVFWFENRPIFDRDEFLLKTGSLRYLGKISSSQYYILLKTIPAGDMLYCIDSNDKIEKSCDLYTLYRHPLNENKYLCHMTHTQLLNFVDTYNTASGGLHYHLFETSSGYLIMGGYGSIVYKCERQ